MREFSREEIYGCSLKEFCESTFTTPEFLIKGEKAKIAMLQKSYFKYREEILKTDYRSERWEYFIELLTVIKVKMDKAKRNLARYVKEKDESGNEGSDK